MEPGTLDNYPYTTEFRKNPMYVRCISNTTNPKRSTTVDSVYPVVSKLLDLFCILDDTGQLLWVPGVDFRESEASVGGYDVGCKVTIEAVDGPWVDSNFTVGERYIGEIAADARWIYTTSDHGVSGNWGKERFKIIGPLAVVSKHAEDPDVKEVSQQPHYARYKIQPLVFISENNLPFWAGNVIKYVCRYDAKDGIKDLKKARDYLDKQISLMEGDTNWWSR